MNEPKTFAEAGEDFRQAVIGLFDAICEKLHITNLAAWLSKRLTRKS